MLFASRHVAGIRRGGCCGNGGNGDGSGDENSVDDNDGNIVVNGVDTTGNMYGVDDNVNCMMCGNDDDTVYSVNDNYGNEKMIMAMAMDIISNKITNNCDNSINTTD